MATATLQLRNGASVVIEGTPEEVHQLLSLHSDAVNQSTAEGSSSKPKPHKIARSPTSKSKEKSLTTDDQLDLTEVINLIKTCDDAESIEERILDRTGQVNRVLLPLYVVHEYLDNAFGLTSGEVTKITTDLGIPVSRPNASTTLSSTASRYVVGDSVRKKGRAVRYKLHRRGVQYMKSVISGDGNEDQE